MNQIQALNIALDNCHKEIKYLNESILDLNIMINESNDKQYKQELQQQKKQLEQQNETIKWLKYTKTYHVRRIYGRILKLESRISQTNLEILINKTEWQDTTEENKILEGIITESINEINEIKDEYDHELRSTLGAEYKG